MKAIEKSLYIRVAVHVDVRVRMAVAGKELPEPQRASRVRRANEKGVAQAACDEHHAPQDERAHEHLADLWILLNEPPKPLRTDDEDIAVLDHTGPHESAASSEDVHFAGELSGALDANRLVPEDTWLDDLEGAVQDDMDAERGGALFVEDLARGNVTLLAVAGDPLELSVVQLGEHLVLSLCGNVAHGQARNMASIVAWSSEGGSRLVTALPDPVLFRCAVCVAVRASRRRRRNELVEHLMRSLDVRASPGRSRHCGFLVSVTC